MTEVVNDPTLGEQLSSIGIVGFSTITEVQTHLADLIERHLDANP